MTWAQLVDSETGGLLVSAGKGLVIGGFAAGIAWVGLSSRVSELEESKADKVDVVAIQVAIQADQRRRDQQHDETLQAIRDLRGDIKDKQDKP